MTTETSTPNLVSDMMTHVRNLLCCKVDLLRAEIGENLNRAVAVLGLIVGAVVAADCA